MALDSLQVSVLRIPFNEAFKHASAERSETQSLWVTAQGNGVFGYGEGCPREYVSGENLAGAQAFVEAHRSEWLAHLHDIGSLTAWVQSHRALIDANPAAWTAVELALLDLFSKQQGKSVEAALHLRELNECFTYTAVLGDSSPAKFEAQLTHYLKAGFDRFKIKLSGQLEQDLAKVAALIAAGITPEKVRADANNLWQDAAVAIAHLGSLNYAFFALEEPLQVDDIDGMRHIATALNTKIILDESFLRPEQLANLSNDAERWIGNVRVSKMGGFLRSLECVRSATQRGLSVIVGAHVGETSLLTRAALAIAQSAGDELLAQEGAFGTHLLSRDVTETPLMFGARGILDADKLELAARPGWGIEVRV